MVATITNIYGEYNYQIENIIDVQYAGKEIILTKLENGKLSPIHFGSNEVIIHINKVA